MTDSASNSDRASQKSDELKALMAIILFLFPILSIVFVGAYGFVIWMIQAFGGVVSH